MRKFIVFGVFLFLLVGRSSLLVYAQVPPTAAAPAPVGASSLLVDEATAASHVIKRVEPIYPPIAKAAHVIGTVELSAKVGADGAVVGVRAIAGPAMLTQAAVDAAKQWKYEPFEQDGKAVAAVVPVVLSFGAGQDNSRSAVEQRAERQTLSFADQECRDPLSARDAVGAAAACGRYVDLAEKAAPGSANGKVHAMTAHQQYGLALLMGGKKDEGLAEEEKAVASARANLKPFDSEYGTAFYWRGTAQQMAGHTSEALADYETAEASMRAAVKQAPQMAAAYDRGLKGVLTQHAALLDKLGRQAEAGKLRQEAASLK